MKNISQEMEVMEMENKIRHIREDLPGDVLLSAKLVLAASDKKWKEVEKFLAEGADPRICRWSGVFGKESALFYSIVESRWDISRKLYYAGDRLDDHIAESETPLPSDALEFLAHEMRSGRNYFIDETKPLSECCRCSAFAQIEKLIPTASQEELNKSILITVNSWIRDFDNSDIYIIILEKLKSYGAKLPDEDRTEALRVLTVIEKWPAIMRPSDEALGKVKCFINNI